MKKNAKIDQNGPQGLFFNISMIKQGLNRALFDLNTPVGRTTNIVGMSVICLSVVLAMIGTLSSVPAGIKNIIQWIELSVTAVFVLEYFLRIWVANKPWKYILSFYGMVDLLTWLPLLLLGDANVAIRLLRVLRLLKLLRYLRALELFLKSLHDVMDILLVLVISIAIIVLVAGNLIYFIEPDTFDNAFAGAWWALVTMTTVGYGDVVPQSVTGKIEAAVLMVIGISMFALLTGTISVKVAHLLNRKHTCHHCERGVAEEFRFCPFCGREQQTLEQTDT